MTYASTFLKEAWARVKHSAVGSLLSLLIVAAGTVGLFATTGLGIASQQRALSVLNTPEGRMITVIDSTGTAGLNATSIATLASLPAVEWVIGLGPARDVHNSWLPAAGSAPSRTLHGSLPPAITTTAKELPPGQALIELDAPSMGMPPNGGPLSSASVVETVAIGAFEASAPLEMLKGSILHRPSDETTSHVRMILISCTDVSQLHAVSQIVRGVISAEQPAQLEIQVSAELGRIGDDVVDELASNARTLLLALLGLTGVLIGAVQFGRVAAMAKDIGRLRALGATRGLIVALMLGMTAVPCLAGAALGTGLGTLVVWRAAGTFPTAGFAIAITTLMVLASLVGTMPPALKAAYADPVQILRVP